MIIETNYGFVILDVIFGIASIVYIFTGVDYVSYPQLHSGKRLPDINIVCHAPAIGAGLRALNVISGRHNIVRKALIKTRLAIDRLC